MPSAVVFLTEGFEEIEAITAIDLLRRGGVTVTTVSINGPDRVVTGSHGIPVTADKLFAPEECGAYDMLVLPGGPGHKNYAKTEGFMALLENSVKAGKYLAAICAAPTVLGALGMLKGKKAVCFPGCEAQLTGALVLTDVPVVQDGNIITSRGAGTSVDFGLWLVAVLEGQAAAEKLARDIVWRQ